MYLKVSETRRVFKYKAISNVCAGYFSEKNFNLELYAYANVYKQEKTL